MNEKDLGRMNMTKRIYNKYEGGLKRCLTFTQGVNCFGAVSLFCLIRNNPPLYPLALFSLHSFVLSCVLGSTKDRMPHVVLFEVNFWQLKDYIRGILFAQWFIPILQPAYLFLLARGPCCPITESFAVTGDGFSAPFLALDSNARKVMGTHSQWRQIPI